MLHGRVTELPENFYIPIQLETNNITSLSPFLVPQDHLSNVGIFYAMSFFMFLIFIVGSFINTLTIICTIQYKKLRSHLNYILVNLAISNLLVSVVGSSVTCVTFGCRYFVFGPLVCKIEGFLVTLGGKNFVSHNINEM